MNIESLVYWAKPAGQPNVLEFSFGEETHKDGSWTQCSTYFPERPNEKIHNIERRKTLHFHY